MMVTWIFMQGMQIDEEMSMATFYQAKHAVNRAVHAGAQQIDPTKLGDGTLSIDKSRANSAAREYLNSNLALDSSGKPLANSFWKQKPEIKVLEVINDDHAFPYTYRNSAYDYEVTLDNPGVVMILEITYPRTFNILDDMKWQVKGAAELNVFSM
jgi:hypothetical protein